MTTEGPRRPDPEEFPTVRESDARGDIEDIREEAAPPIVFKHRRTGAEVSPDVVARVQDPESGEFKEFKPPILTRQEQQEAVAALRGAMEQNAVRYPELANHMVNNPDDIWLLPEITLMFEPRPDEVTNDLVGELASSLTTTTEDIKNYQESQRASKTQELFWNDVGNLYDSGIRDLLLHQLAQLSPDGSDRVGALALAWRDSHDMTDEENKQQLLLNIHQWSYSEDQALLDKEKGGFWTGMFSALDAGQEFVESGVSWLVDRGYSMLASPEEAARRENLTLGQKTAFIFGLRPPDEAGEWGWWRAVSGGLDGTAEIGLDPLNLIAGVGAGVRAAKTIPLAAKATRAGRLATAARANLPRFFSGATRNVRGGRWARIAYSLKAKTVDDLLEQTVKNGVADEALQIVKQGNQAALQRTFPQWGQMSDEMFRTIQETVETPEEFVQVLKAGALDEVLRSGRGLDELERTAEESWEAVRRQAGDDVVRLSGEEDQLARRARSNWNFTAEALRPAVRSILEGGDIAEDTLRQKANALVKWWRVNAEAPGGLKRALNADEIAQWRNLDQGDEFFMDMASTDVGGLFARKATEEGRASWVMEFSDDTKGALNELNQIEAARGGDEWLVSGRFRVDEIDEASQVLRVSPTQQFEAPAQKIDDLLLSERVPRNVRLNAAQAQLRLDAHNAKMSNNFILSDIPQKPRKVFRWTDRFQGKSRGAAATRRVLARATPGRPDDEIELFNTRKATNQLDKLFRHFGMREETIDDLLNEFMELDLGARQDWFWDRAIRELGNEIGVPAFQHNLIQFYKGGGVSKYAGSGSDVWVNAAGKARRGPILSNQMTTKIPIPLDELDEVAARARSMARPKVAKATAWVGRGLTRGTKRGAAIDRRRELISRLRGQLGDEAANMDDDDLWHMAYSLVNPDAGLDGRGWWSGLAMPKAGSAFNKLHRKFTKLMLVTRPIQWMWRVALLEEPIRAHLFNMPSMYSNPLQYMGAAREAYLIDRLSDWARANSDFGHDVYRTLTRGAGRDGLVRRLSDHGILDDVFGEGVENLTLPQLRNGVANFIDDALHSRTRITKLDPIKRVGWATRRRARKIEKAENALERMGLPADFSFADDTDIGMKLVSGYLGEAVGTSDSTKLYQWTDAMTETESYLHGQVWGAKLMQLAEDPLARKAIHVKAARLAGSEEDVADAIVNSSRWELLRGDMRLRFPDVEDELELARKYVDEVVGPEIDHLFKPFLDELDGDEAAELLEEFARNRQISTELYGQRLDWDLRDANYAGGQRAVGDFTAAMRGRPGVAIPDDLPAVSLDARFMAHDDPGWIKRFSNWTLHTFGEEATQALNRRPAWLREFGRWNKHYTNLGVPDEVAKRLAQGHANQMVNYVFFQMNEAPHYAAKLNQYFPFAGATYEVLSTWTYKLPTAVGGSWPLGVGEFTRKIDRLMDGLVNTGLVTRQEEDDGSLSYTLNLVPPDSSAASQNELGRVLQGAGFKMVNTLDQVISTLFGLEEGLELRSQGYRLATGHPLNPTDYGTLSFAQANLGLNPQSNLGLSLAGRFLGAGKPERSAVQPGGETLGDVTERLDMDINDLVRYNREVFVDTEGLAESVGFESGSDLYNAILAGVVDPFEIDLPEETILNVPETSFWDGFIKEVFQPFGDVDNAQEFGINFLPGAMRWALAGFALQNQPSDEFWSDTDLGGIFGGVLPEINEAQVASQLNEAFMYLEAHDLVNGRGPFTRIQEKEERLQRLLDSGNEEAANRLKKEIEQDTEAFLGRAQKVAAESLILRSFTGQFLPTAPGHVRKEQELIQQYWDTLEYSDSIRVGKGEAPRLANFGSIEEMENYYEQLSAWLNDPTGDRARATFRQNYPQLQAYLTPKTFYSEPVPDVNSYQEYQEQIESGEREPAPLHVTMWRARSSAIQADFYNKYISKFGNDPQQAAANALHQREEWQNLNDERNRNYQALEMWDDMYGGVYDAWRTENFEDDNWAQDQITDKLNTIRDNLGIVLELEDTFDVELDLQGIDGLNSALRASIAEISNAIRDYSDFTENTDNRNAYEKAINQYFEEVYIPYQEEISALYDQLPEVADSEKQSLIYERIKLLKNDFAGSTVFLNEDTSVPFPNPLEYSWNGKDEEERTVKVQQWLTRPLEWIDQDQAIRITERNPDMVRYLPTADAEFGLYREATLAKTQVDEMFEQDEITRSQRNEMMDGIDEQVRQRLLNQGRNGEIEYMDMTPYEKLEVSGELPGQLEIFGDAARYYKEVLEVTEESPGTVRGRQMVAPLYNQVEDAFFSDPDMRQTIQELGINLQDEDTLDNFLPWLFFGYTGER